MRKCLCLLLLLTGCSQPDFYDTRGLGHRYADYDGKWLVINYWATWCAPCKTEIPELIALDRNQPDVVVLGVNYGQPGQVEMEKQITEMGITFPVYQRDPYQRFGSRRPLVLPTTFVVSPDGKLMKVLTGPQTEASLLAVMGKPG